MTEPGDEVGRIARKPVYSGRIVNLSVDRVRFPGGSEGELELVTHPGASAVLPFLDSPDAPDPRVLLLRQYRYAAGGTIWEVPAGMPDGDDEDWESCARRELLEETGYEAGDIRYLTRIFTTPGFTDEVIHLFAATDLEEGEFNRDHDEFIEVVALPFSEVMEMVGRGEVIDAKSLATLLFAASFLGAVWGERRSPPPRVVAHGSD